MRVGVVILPDLRWRSGREVWQRAEALGAHTAWTYDHLTWRELRDGPWFGAVPLLAAAAEATTSIRLGTLVTSPNFRHPVTLAKEVMTLDEVSSGRFTLGIGAGGTGWDATALGQEPWDPRERSGRFAEMVDQLDELLRSASTERLDGQWYSARDARSVPGCTQSPRVPFAVAGAGPRAMAVAAKHGEAWVTYGLPGAPDDVDPSASFDAVRDQAALLDDACAAVGRDPRSMDRLYLQGISGEPWLESVESFRDLSGRYEELGFTDVALHWPRSAPPFVADLAVFEEIVASGV
jgi:alkanesulfonate monooxygenase SsuD/methylene tetrahydromethanopterin reductase-like flavin-dependent oxidoreductase (luciferase family)